MRTAILVVEDDASIRESLETMLTEDGYSVVTARDGVHALDLLRNESPSLILADMYMPQMGGVDLWTRLRELDPDIPVVLMTAAVDESQAPAGSVVLRKPFDLSELKEVVERYCGGAASR